MAAASGGGGGAGGGIFGKLKRMLGFPRNEVQILVIGLDNSGKTTIINHIKPKQLQSNEVTPTVGFSVEEFAKDNIHFTIFDMSGQSRYRELWEHYYRDVQAIVYVLDSTDRIRMAVAKDELEMLLNHKDIQNRNIPVLFFANKMDLAGAMQPVDIVDLMELDGIEEKPWHITRSNALTGAGVDEGVSWLAEHSESAGRKTRK
mmetsp:Transcript_10121/g.21335  ORF Transcript_10121/g.21335 Transcript_10121/m.21335 type:complete len:203 (-) Transcript_10121:334-942(-)|eukprot:CAMPEP_0182542234 /NCGR_PEP_ID=MMETSP1323-20130603/29850_1 /TAXON_ID=236787 /ORGANISM="Florenciella parvula, Strain RCC1693" /LENGTH=202 /DNA_ID=CAMNT_0024753069 /DNA_START=118 /DNA_END=726 /DNA_ORIENTATION=-